MNRKIKYLLWSIAIILLSIVLVIQWSDWPIIGLMLGGSIGLINAIVFYFLNKTLTNKLNNKFLLNALRILSILVIHYLLFFTYLKLSGYQGFG